MNLIGLEEKLHQESILTRDFVLMSIIVEDRTRFAMIELENGVKNLVGPKSPLILG